MSYQDQDTGSHDSGIVCRRIECETVLLKEMTLAQADLTKTPQKGGANGGGLWGSSWNRKTTNLQALLGTMSLLILNLMLVMAWRSAGSGASTLVLNSQNNPKLIDLQLGRHLETDPSVWQEPGGGEVTTDIGSLLVARAAHEFKLSSTTIGDPGPKDESSLPSTSDPIAEKTSISTIRAKESTGSNLTASIAGGELSETRESEDTGSTSEAEVCDLTRGRWEKDGKPPFYSGKECKAYLSAGFACRQMTRPDFDYEKLRWQPAGCDLPSFHGEAFLQRVRNKVVAFVGDSLGREQFQSLMCMVTEGKDDGRNVKDVHRKWQTKWAYRFRKTNTTILFYWSASLCEIEDGHPEVESGYSAMHLDRPDRFLEKFFDKIDVLVLNTGHHWNRGKLEKNKWQRYVGGKPLADRKLAEIAQSLNFTVHNVVKWLDQKLAEGKPKPAAVFFRTLSPRHFRNGDWDSGGKCDAARSAPPLLNVTENNAMKPNQLVYKGPIMEKVAELAVRGSRVKLLDITHLSLFRDDAHISKYGLGKDSEHQDCLHWCLPGVPDVWNELLYANLLMTW